MRPSPRPVVRQPRRRRDRRAIRARDRRGRSGRARHRSLPDSDEAVRRPARCGPVHGCEVALSDYSTILGIRPRVRRRVPALISVLGVAWWRRGDRRALRRPTVSACSGILFVAYLTYPSCPDPRGLRLVRRLRDGRSRLADRSRVRARQPAADDQRKGRVNPRQYRCRRDLRRIATIGSATRIERLGEWCRSCSAASTSGDRNTQWRSVLRGLRNRVAGPPADPCI
jgi:hypothetical protein